MFCELKGMMESLKNERTMSERGSSAHRGSGKVEFKDTEVGEIGSH